MEIPHRDFLFSSKKRCLISCWQHMLSNSRSCGCPVPCVGFSLLLFSVWLFSSALLTPLSPELLVLFRANLHSPARSRVVSLLTVDTRGEDLTVAHSGKAFHHLPGCRSTPSTASCDIVQGSGERTSPVLIAFLSSQLSQFY